MLRRDRPASTVTTLLTANMAGAALVTTSVNALGPSIRADLGLSTGTFSLVASTAFLATAATSLPCGWLVDRLPVRTMATSVFALAAVALGAVALADSLAGLLVGAVLGGCALALSGVVTNAAVGRFVERGRRGRALAAKQMGVPIGQIAAGTLAPAVAAVGGWSAGVGVLALAVAGGTVATWQGGRAAFASPVAAEPLTGGRAPRTVGSGRLVVVLTTYAFLTGVCFQVALFAMPLIGREELGLSIQAAALPVVVTGAAALAARACWGLVADRLPSSRGVIVALPAVMALGSANVALALGLHAHALFWCGAVLIGAAFALAPILIGGTVLARFPVQRVGALSGATSLATFAGFAAGPGLYSIVAQHSEPLIAWLVTAAVAVLGALVPFCAPPAGWRTGQAH